MNNTTDDYRRGTLREKGQLTLPTDVRVALHIEAGDEIEFQILDGGQVLMQGLKMIPADQAWFWTDAWQHGEREASADIEYDRVETFKDPESLLSFLHVDDEDN